MFPEATDKMTQGKSANSRSRVAVVGAGISGLATAYYLQKAAHEKAVEMDVVVLDQSDQAGGVICTQQVDGFLLEWGPENFVPFRKQILDLIHAVGLSDQVIGSNDHIRRTFVVDGGRLRALPDGMAFLAPVNLRSFWATRLISRRGKLRACLEPLVRRSRGDLSVYDFLQRRLGAELTEKVAEPLVSAIYGGDIRKLSLASALPDTYAIEQRYGSLWKGMRRSSRGRGSARGAFFQSLRGGMQTLVEALVEHVGHTSFRWACGAAQMKRKGGQYVLSTADGEDLFDGLVLATPAAASATLLEPLSRNCAGWLREIPYTSTQLIYLAYRKADFSHPLEGFGFVMPENEAAVFDACTWVSSKFEDRCPAEYVLLRCAIHDGRRPRYPASDEVAIERVHNELTRILGISCSPVFARARAALGGMPQPNVRHAHRLAQIKQELHRLPGIFVANAYWGGVGVPSCVATAEKTAQAMVRYLEESVAKVVI